MINEELNSINNKIDNLKLQAEEKIKKIIEPKKINNKIDKLKIDSINDLKKFIKG